MGKNQGLELANSVVLFGTALVVGLGAYFWIARDYKAKKAILAAKVEAEKQLQAEQLKAEAERRAAELKARNDKYEADRKARLALQAEEAAQRKAKEEEARAAYANEQLFKRLVNSFKTSQIAMLSTLPASQRPMKRDGEFIYHCLVPVNSAECQLFEITVKDKSLTKVVQFFEKDPPKEMAVDEFLKIPRTSPYLTLIDKKVYVSTLKMDANKVYSVPDEHALNPAREEFGALYDYLVTNKFKFPDVSYEVTLQMGSQRPIPVCIAKFRDDLTRDVFWTEIYEIMLDDEYKRIESLIARRKEKEARKSSLSGGLKDYSSHRKVDIRGKTSVNEEQRIVSTVNYRHVRPPYSTYSSSDQWRSAKYYTDWRSRVRTSESRIASTRAMQSEASDDPTIVPRVNEASIDTMLRTAKVKFQRFSTTNIH